MKVKVFVSITLSRTLDIDVKEGYNDVDLREAVIRSNKLPQTTGWYRNEFTVIKD